MNKPLYVCNLNRERLCNLRDQSEFSVRNITLKTSLNEIAELSFDLPMKNPKSKFIQNENLVLFDDEYYIIKTPTLIIDNDGKQSRSVTCRHLSDILANNIVSLEEIVPVNVVTLMKRALIYDDKDNPTQGWSVGNVTVDRVACRGLETTEESCFSVLLTIAEKYEGVLQFNSQDMTVDMFPAKEQSVPKFNLRFSKNLKGIEVSYDTSELITRLYCYGGADDNGNDIDIMSVNPTGMAYIDNFEYFLSQGYTQDFINKHPTLFIRTNVWRDDSFYDSADLYKQGLIESKRVGQPVIELKVDALASNIAYGQDITRLKVGDCVSVYDSDLNLDFLCNVTSREIDENEPHILKIEVTNAITYVDTLGKLYLNVSNASKVVTSGGGLRGEKIDGITVEQISNLDLYYLTAEEIATKYITTQYLKSNYIDANEIHAKYLTAVEISAAYATIANLEATNAYLHQANIDIADIITLISGSTTTGSLQAIMLNAQNAVIDSGFFKSLVAQLITVSDLKAGTIYTDTQKIMSRDGEITLTDNTMQFKKNGVVRIQIGEDANGEFGLYQRDEKGNLQWDSNGLTEKGITKPIIKNNMVSSGANIDGSKLNISSVVTQINNGTTKINSSHVLYDGKSLDVAFNSMTSSVNTVTKTVTDSKSKWDTASTNASSALSTANGIKSTVESNKSNWDKAGSALSAAQGAQSAIDGLQVGGRNLIGNTKPRELTGWSYVTANATISIIDEPTALSKKAIKFTFSKSTTGGGIKTCKRLDVGQKYSWSIWIKCSRAVSMKVGQEQNGAITCNVTQEWQKFTNTFVATDAKYNNFVFYALTAQTPWLVGDILYVHSLILTEGTKVGTWSEAPEDTENQITTVTESLKTLSTQFGIEQGKITGLITDTTQTKKDITAMSGDVVKAKGNISTLQTNYNSMQATVSGISTTLGQHTSSISTLTTGVSNLTTGLNNLRTTGLGMMVNYSYFNGPNDGECFLHGFDANGNPADVNGWIMWKGSKITLRKGMWVNPNSDLPYNTMVYLVVNGSRTGIFNAWYDIATKKWMYMYCTNAPVNSGEKGTFTWSDTHIVIGYYVNSSKSEEAFTNAGLYDPVRSHRDIIASPEITTSIKTVTDKQAEFKSTLDGFTTRVSSVESTTASLSEKTNALELLNFNNFSRTGNSKGWSNALGSRPVFTLVDDSLYGKVAKSTSSLDESYYSPFYEVDANKSYKLGLALKRLDTVKASAYFGIYCYNANKTLLGVYTDNGKSLNTNFYYYYSSSIPKDTWITTEGYLMSSTVSREKLPKGYSSVGAYIPNAVMQPSTKYVRIRFLNFYHDANVPATILFAQPFISEVDTNIGSLTSEVSTVSNKQAELKSTVDQFKSTVETTYTTKADFDGLKPSSANLLKNTALTNDAKYFSMYSGITRVVNQTPNPYGHTNCFYYNISGLTEDKWYSVNPDRVPVYLSATYIASCYVWIPSGVTFDGGSSPHIEISAFDKDGVRIGNKGTPVDTSLVNTWQRVTTTYTIPVSSRSINARVWIRRNGRLYVSALFLGVGNRDSGWYPHMDDMEYKLAAYATTSALSSAITQTTKDIKLNVSETYTTKATFNASDELNRAIALMATGKLLRQDPTFKKDNNGVGFYNNAGNGNTTVTRVAKPADCPTTSTHCMKIRHTGAGNPGLGGFVQTIQSRANAKFVIKYLIKLPVGRKLFPASNAMGNGYTDKFLGSTDGTGKWEEYIRVVNCGSTGTFSTGGHTYISGAVPTASSPLEWYLGAIYQYDVTDADDVYETISQANASIKVLSDSIKDTVTTTNNLSSKVTTLTQNSDKFTIDVKATYNKTNLIVNSDFTNNLNGWANSNGGFRVAGSWGSNSTTGHGVVVEGKKGTDYHLNQKIELSGAYAIGLYYSCEVCVIGYSAGTTNPFVALYMTVNYSDGTVGYYQRHITDISSGFKRVGFYTSCKKSINYVTATLYARDFTGKAYFSRPFLTVSERALLPEYWAPSQSEITGNTKVQVDYTGLSIYGGALSIYNNAGTKVLSGDTNGNLSMIGVITASAGSFGGWTINNANGSIESITKSTSSYNLKIATEGSKTSSYLQLNSRQVMLEGTGSISISTGYPGVMGQTPAEIRLNGGNGKITLSCGSNTDYNSQISSDAIIAKYGEFGYSNKDHALSASSIISNEGIRTNDAYYAGNTVYGSQNIELYGNPPHIDFHAYNSTVDYTSRLVDWGNDYLTCDGKKFHAPFGSMMGTLYTTPSEWIGFYDVSLSTRKAWIGHDGGTDFTIANETGKGISLLANGGRIWYEFNSDNTLALRPAAAQKDQIALGYSWARWTTVYAKSGSISTSDRNMKHDIFSLDTDTHKRLFMALKPVSYILNNADSNRTHFGYISQDVEYAMNQLGMTSSDFAGFCKDQAVDIITGSNGEETAIKKFDKNGNPVYEYSLRYEEFISLNTMMIQDTIKQVSLLRNKYDNKLAELNNIINKLQEADENNQSQIKELRCQLTALSDGFLL